MNGEQGVLAAVPFPFADLQTTKRRPVLVLTNPDYFGDFVCLAVTSAPTHQNSVPITTTDMDE